MRLPSFLHQSVLLILLAVFLVPGGDWPLREAKPHAEPVAEEMAMGDMPCGEAMGMKQPAPKPDPGDPCQQGCCPLAFCDFAACLATGVLPPFAWLPPALPVSSIIFAWHTSEPLNWPAETALRPPIA